MKIGVLLGAAVLATLTACAQFDAQVRGAPEVTRDQDEKLRIRTAALGAATSLAQGANGLGFAWLERRSDEVQIDVDLPGTVIIEEVSLQVDGVALEVLGPVGKTRLISDHPNGTRSMRRFSLDFQEFERLAAGQDIRMRLSTTGGLSASRFGPANGEASVNYSIAPFLAKVIEMKGAPKE